ncbi:MAG: type IV toxin-antitoxin system AbiEi family antitoxin domain-containing protein [Nocardioidaceae bacterium]|nr:type IV toxin-antitoxin system AbiEi family antitoxin domain-containing protein [Nocardioidaceae bacterium]MCL2612794.1 type IV toxin-antitoxin system AbiEi family antitoxin domain-containing protein [Nocardioidaceae bacterium]
MTFGIGHPDLQHLLRRLQDGVVSRRQLLAMGATPNDLRRMLRRRELFQIHPGVYADHNGRATRAQQEWVAVLAAWPAALGFESALPDHPGFAVQVVIADDRTVRRPPHAVVHRIGGIDARVDWRASPPRVRLEHATIDVMSRAIGQDDVASAFTTLCTVIHSRRTSVARIEQSLAGRGRVAGRRTLAALLADARTGACSVLERGYLHRVERAHGLPTGARQRRSTATGGVTLQDVRYDDQGLVVELDGLLHERPRARDADARRDLAELAISDGLTARVTYGLVFGGQCATAAWIARILRRRGWQGTLITCPTARRALDLRCGVTC